MSSEFEQPDVGGRLEIHIHEGVTFGREPSTGRLTIVSAAETACVRPAPSSQVEPC